MILFGLFELNEIYTLFLHFHYGCWNILNYTCRLYHTAIGPCYPRDKFGAYREIFARNSIEFLLLEILYFLWLLLHPGVGRAILELHVKFLLVQ